MPAFDVIFLSVEDWANVGASLAEACRRVGLRAVSITQKEHGFDYPLKSEYFKDWPNLPEVVLEARAVVHMHSHFFDKLPRDMNRQKIAVFHGGTRYRVRPELLARTLYPKVHRSFIQTHDLMGFGSKNETWLIPPIDTELLKTRIRHQQVVEGGKIFGCYPRATGDGAISKGYHEICKVMKKYEAAGIRFWHSIQPVKWEEQIARVMTCDIYIERLSPVVKEWGVAALEAAAMGKIVITNFEGREEYEKVFGPCPMIIANTPEELDKKVGMLAGMSYTDFEWLALDHRRWIEHTHSMEATGKYLKEQLMLD